MGNVNYTAQEGLKLLGSEVGAWLTETTVGTVGCSLGGLCSPNLVNYPENIDNAVWSKSFVTVTKNAIQSFDGALSAEKIQATASTERHRVTKTFSHVANSLCASFHLKAGTTNSARLQLWNATDGIYAGTGVNLTTGVLSNSIGTVGIENKGDGWFRVYVIGISTVTSSTIMLYVDTLIDANTTTVGTENIYAIGGVVTQTSSLEGYGSSHDISNNDLALQTNGELTKSAVATGAELMGWSGWSTSNYLSRVYGADLDFSGTDTLSICAWVKTTTITGTQGICGNLSAGGSGDRGGYGLRLVGSKLEFAVSDSSGILTQATDASDFTANVWVFICGTLSAAGQMILYKNGVRVASASGATIDATAELFQVGVETSAGVPANAFAGSAALCKVHDAVLTAAQIKTIYNAEKHLFKSYSIYTQVGVSYDLALSFNTANRSESVSSSDAISLNGNQETTFLRRDTTFNLNIIRLTASSLPAVRNFLHSVEAGQSFTFDRYGSAGSPDDPVTVVASPGFTESRNGVDDYYTIGLNVREVP